MNNWLIFFGIIVIIVHLLCGHWKFQVLENLDVGSEDQAFWLPINPGSLGLILYFVHVELLEECFIKLRQHLWRLYKGVAEGHREIYLKALDFKLGPVFTDPVVLLESV